MINKDFKEQIRQENRLDSKGSNNFGDTVSSLGLLLNKDNGEIHIKSIVIGELNAEARHRN